MSYTNTPKVVRLYEESGKWFIDGFDPDTVKYTDAVWSYDTRAEALENLGEFILDYPDHYMFTWEWPTDHEYQVGDTVFLTEHRMPASVVGITDEHLFVVDMGDTGVYDTFSEEFIEPYRADLWHGDTTQPEDGRAPWEDSYQAYGHM